MADKEHEHDELTDEELEGENAERLPDREAMSLLIPPGTATIAPEDGAPPTLPVTE